MGTSNFYYRNTSKIYAVLLNDDYDNTIKLRQEELEEFLSYELSKCKDLNDDYNYKSCDDLKSQYDLRSYPSKSIGSISKNNNSFEIQIDIFIRSGYYQGACLDWELKITSVDCWYSSIELEKCVENVNNDCKKILNFVESVFEKCSENQFRLIGSFSNGESLYEKINS